MSEKMDEQDRLSHRGRADWWLHRRELLFPQGDPMMVAGGMRQYLFDFDENPALDFSAGGGTMPMGHNHPHIQYMIDQGKAFYQTGSWGASYQGMHIEYADFLYNNLHEGFREGVQFQFFASENEAVLAVLDMVWAKGGRFPVLAVNRRRIPLGCQRTMVTHDAKNARHSAYFVSPIDPDTHEAVDSGVLADIIARAARERVPVIWDDTVSGFGWTGSVLTIPDYADYAVLGGALGGGLPLGAVVGRNQVMPDSLNRLGGSALAFWAGLETLRQVEGMVRSDRITSSADLLDLELIRMTTEFPDSVLRLTGSGLLRGMVMSSEAFAQHFVQECRRNGLVLDRYKPVVRIAAPLIVQPDDIKEMAGIVLESIMKVRQGNGE